MNMSRQALGKWGEATAADFLEKQGYSIVERNCRTPYGEIDLVAYDGAVFVFVEVKTRATDAFGFPEEAVDTLVNPIFCVGSVISKGLKIVISFWSVNVPPRFSSTTVVVTTEDEMLDGA